MTKPRRSPHIADVPLATTKPRVTSREASMAVTIATLKEQNATLASENTRLRLQIGVLEQGPKDDTKMILGTVNGLRAAFQFHMDANTLAVNALSANIANLMAKKT